MSYMSLEELYERTLEEMAGTLPPEEGQKTPEVE